MLQSHYLRGKRSMKLKIIISIAVTPPPAKGAIEPYQPERI